LLLKYKIIIYFITIITFNIFNITFYSPLLLSNEEPRVYFFPLTTNVMWRDDFNLWDTIGKYLDPLFDKYFYELYDPAVDVLNSIPSVDVRFAALIEFGNAVFINEYRDSFKRINRHLTEMIINRDPDIILVGLKNYLITYCDKEGSEYYPDYGLCYRSRGTLINILKLLNDFKDIKGGDEEIKNDVNSFYRTFMKKLYKKKMIPASWLENIIL